METRRFGVGLQLPEVEREVRWAEVAAIARAAEEVGFTSLWVGDHLLYRDDGREERGPWDAWSVLAALAATTRTVALGPLVACTAFSNPGLLARKAAAVQEISGGRLVLGLGAGWNETEFDAFGLPYGHRFSRFAESFEITRRLLSGERVTFDGRFEQARDAVVLPQPLRPPVLMIGSTGERVLRLALPDVDAWNIWYDWYGNTPSGFASAAERTAALARDVGRDPDTITLTATVFVSFAGEGRDRPHTSDVAPVSGGPESIARQLMAFVEAGVEEVIVVLSPIDESAVRRLGAALDLMPASPRGSFR